MGFDGLASSAGQSDGGRFQMMSGDLLWRDERHGGTGVDDEAEVCCSNLGCDFDEWQARRRGSSLLF